MTSIPSINIKQLSNFFLVMFFFASTISFAQCGSCTNPTGNVSVGFGQSICYNSNTTVTSFTIFFDGVVRICDSTTVIVTSGSSFSGTGQIQLGNCSQLIFQGSFNGSVPNGVVYVGDGSCNALFQIEGASTLGTSLTSNSEIIFCNLNNSPLTGSPGAATVGCGLPLPIKLVNFQTSINKNIVEINWTTASEINNDYFTIERSQDAVNWQSLKDLTGAGNSNTLLFYSEIDNNPLFGISYYRLKQTDFDGEFSYSKIQVINYSSKQVKLNIYYNENKLTISTIANRPILKVESINMNGQITQLRKLSSTAFNLSSLQSGIYLIRVHLENEIIVRKIVIN